MPGALFDEAHDALMGLRPDGLRHVGFPGDRLHGPAEDGRRGRGPGRVARSRWSWRLTVTSPPRKKIAHLLASLGEKILAGARGADRLGCGQKVIRRIKWRLVWEIAALFVGFGEIKAVVRARQSCPGCCAS